MENDALQKAVFDVEKNGEIPLSGFDVSRLAKLRNWVRGEIATTNGRTLRILDVGSGYGDLLSPFVHDADLYALDITEAGIRECLRKGYKEAKVCNLETDRFPFSDEFFDMVVFSEVIEHLYDVDNFMAEINRVLKPNKSLVFTFPNVNSLTSHFMMLFLDYPPKFCSRYKSVHVRDWTVKTVRKVLTIYGFYVANIEGVALLTFGDFALGKMLSKFLPRMSEDVAVWTFKKGRGNRDKRVFVLDTKDI